MRVVAGTLGGRRLAVPPGRSTRPTSEMLRAAIFNSLDARGALDGATVADLFAGSGALGIEALSRGASTVTFVESDRRAARVLEENVTALSLTSRAIVEVLDVCTWAPRHRGALDVVLADPPYRFDRWDDVFAALVTFPASLVVAESDRPLDAAGWDTVAVRRHGGSVISQLRPRGATTA